MKQTIYLDMDGVLADFNLAAQQLLKVDNAETDAAARRGRWQPDQWNIIKQNPNFYRFLPKTTIADQLVQHARHFAEKFDFDLRVLTAIPKNNDMPEAFHDKILWIQQHFPGLRVFFGPYSQDKHKFATPESILIDDREDNCRDWRTAGGIAVKVDHTDLKQTLKDLDQIFLQKFNYNYN